MKRFFLFFLVFILGMSAAAAQERPQPGTDWAKELLVSAYGYSPEEAEAFSFTRQVGADGQETVLASPAGHPDWVYSFCWLNPQWTPDMTSSLYARPFPEREGALRRMLRRAQEEAWFPHWGDEARQSAAAFFEAAEEPLPALLAEPKLSAAQAVDSLFVAWCGEKAGWSPALWQWREETLVQYGLQPYRQKENRLSYAWEDRGSALTVTHFQGLVPYEFSEALNLPQLKGWQCLSGAALERSAPSGFRWGGWGLAAFARGEERLLMLLRISGENIWQAVPVSRQALVPGKEVFITCAADSNVFLVEIPLTETESVWWEVSPGYNGAKLCLASRFARVNRATGEGVLREDGAVTVYQSGRAPRRLSAPAEARLPWLLNFVDVGAVLSNETGTFPWEMLPLNGPDTVLSLGAHLRAKTSSRSRDLGMVQPGVSCQLLEIVPGDPSPWAHVRIGSLEGYISGAYVYGPALQICSNPQLVGYRLPPLTVARTKKETTLKKETGWFSAAAAALPAGARMHVLLQRGDWLYVAVPPGEPGPFLEMDSIFGFIKADDVVLADTALELDWQTE